MHAQTVTCGKSGSPERRYVNKIEHPDVHGLTTLALRKFSTKSRPQRGPNRPMPEVRRSYSSAAQLGEPSDATHDEIAEEEEWKVCGQ